MIAVAAMVLLLATGVPIAFSIALALGIQILGTPFSFGLLSQRIFSGLDSFAILAVPLFVLAGELMNASGITDRIVRLANALVGHFRGGLAHVNIWASVIFAGLSGSAIADASALGRVFIPSMEEEGYPRAFAAALTAASSVIGPIVPPSIPVIIYALVASNVSVPALFLGGVGPGLLLALALSVYVTFFVRGVNVKHGRPSWRNRARAIRDGLVPLAMPVFVIGAIVGGVMTPTEAASLAVAYALIAGFFLLGTLKVRDLPDIFIRSMRDASLVLIIMAAVAAGNWMLTFDQVPQRITQFVVSTLTSPWAYLIAVNVLLLFVGLVLEGIAAMLVLVPILHPIALSLGIDPTHFGIVVIFNLMIGLVTPPMGLCLFVADSIAGVGIWRITRRILPMFLVEVIVLLFITFVPVTITWLPRLLGF